ncbi:MAG: PP2C family protein-serine/threonine phosphatase, partial [Terracidiphilus sp.]
PKRVLAVVCLLYWFVTPVNAAPPKQKHAEKAVAVLDTTKISLGQATAPLFGPWKFQAGDSPLDPVTHAPLWADPDFDDSKWETVNLMPKDGTFDPVGIMTAYVPGWTARGHERYWGYAWYRMRVHLEARPGDKLALAGPSDLDDAYEIFANGVKLGSYGDFSGARPVVSYNQPKVFPFPQSAVDDPGSSTQVLAIRVWMDPYTLALGPGVGGLHGAPVLGVADALKAGYKWRRQELFRSLAAMALEALLFAALGIGALGLILFDRSDHVYLWIGAVFLLMAVYNALGALDSFMQHVNLLTDHLVSFAYPLPLIYIGWVMVWWVWFGHPKPATVPRIVACLAVAYMLSYAVSEEFFLAVVPHPVAAAAQAVSLIVRLLLFLLLVRIVIEGIYKQGLEGWPALPAVVLLGVGMFKGELASLHMPVSWSPYGVRVNLDQLTNLMVVAVLALLLLRRLVLSIRRQRLMTLDVKQAQEVQQVIMPEAHFIVPGLNIESEYRPAREVGGDFFQILPNEADGSVLIVAGDVTGKGLKAGMLVALLVGTIRTAAGLNSDPEFVLRELNKRMLGRGDVFATCLALSIAANGEVILVNAGHLPPYLNGQPVMMEGALPLGIIENVEFSKMNLRMSAFDRLVMMSDGVMEAMDAEGNLFGFERVSKLLQKAIS